MLNRILKRADSLQFYEFLEFEGPISGMEVQEIIHTEVLNCLVKLRGAAYARSIWETIPSTLVLLTPSTTFCKVPQNQEKWYCLAFVLHYLTFFSICWLIIGLIIGLNWATNTLEL